MTSAHKINFKKNKKIYTKKDPIISENVQHIRKHLLFSFVQGQNCGGSNEDRRHSDLQNYFFNT